jgi:hypothetical protein
MALLPLAGCESDTKKLEAIQAMGHLAPLPSQAQNVQVAASTNMFAGSFWLRFEAPPEAIEAFLAGSPGLAGVPPAALCATAPAQKASGSDEVFARKGEGCEPHSLNPPPKQSWFDAARVEKGRLYAIPQDSHANGGTLLVDDVHHVVYVEVSHS